MSLLSSDVKGDLYAVEEYEDVRTLKSLIQQHLKFTGSQRARTILLNWDKERMKFKKVSDTAVSSAMQCHSFVLKLHAVLHAVLAASLMWQARHDWCTRNLFIWTAGEDLEQLQNAACTPFISDMNDMMSC